jgi:hypothetical protein
MAKCTKGSLNIFMSTITYYMVRSIKIDLEGILGGSVLASRFIWTYYKKAWKQM